MVRNFLSPRSLPSAHVAAARDYDRVGWLDGQRPE